MYTLRARGGPSNGSGVELRRPGTSLPDGTTPTGRWPRSEATCYARTINRTRGEAFDCSNTVLGGADDIAESGSVSTITKMEGLAHLLVNRIRELQSLLGLHGATVRAMRHQNEAEDDIPF
jgi:hypothetical protein